MSGNALFDDENWQLMTTGQWYQTNSKALVSFRREIKRQCQQFNQAQGERRKLLQRALLPNVEAVIGNHFACDYGFQINSDGIFTVGEFLTILDGASVKIGAETIIGDGVVITSVEHHKSPQARLQGWQKARPVIIGKRVTIGNGVTILPGAVIADDAVIADGEIVGRQ